MVTAPWRRAHAARRVFVIGVPRSGTSWIGSVLSRAPGAVYVNEPDSPEVHDAAAAALEGMWRRGPLAPGAAMPRAFEALWAEAFRTPRRGTLRGRASAVVVKSVKGHLSVEWIADRFAPKVVVVRADPLSVLASWLRMGWGAWPLTPVWIGEFRPDLLAAVGGWPSDTIEQAAVEIGVKACMQEELLARHPDWLAVAHEDLCADPVAGFEALFASAGLDFTGGVRAFIESTNTPGAGHDITRVRSEAARRSERLAPDDRARALAILERLPLALAENKSAGLASGAPVP